MKRLLKMIINYKLASSLCCRSYERQEKFPMDWIDFIVMDTPTFTKEITRPLPIRPLDTSFDEEGYLRDYRQFYDFELWSGKEWVKELKKEYRENRPTYTIIVTYKQIDGYFTEKGKQTIAERYNKYLKLLNRYEKIMEKIGLDN